ncbi:MAG TPA: methyltransferase domain-containing protein [Candidatus Acidoferrales bacterium]|jgi:ubiquinone/menaquinone biosynthesis C-methylase UbiE|nr:methyltransferase domain-containing protein [Candidatus Acidoferrales bacterium]
MREKGAIRGEESREEFNRWAVAGRGEEMERDHRRIAEQMLGLMGLEPTDNVLDVGCGAGWLARLVAARVPEGRVVGMDVSDEMVHRARRAHVQLDHVLFVVGGVDEIPWEDNFFDRAVSVESAYYWPDPARGLRQIFRVLREGGSAWVLINYYRDNPHCHQWGQVFALPTHLLAAEGWAALFREAGFADVSHRRIVDDTPVPPVYTGKWFRDAEQLGAFRAEGALLVHGTKPVGAGPRIPNITVL